MIRLKNLSKVYFKGKRNENLVLDHINLDIAPGELMAITGKSGAGKTTLLHMVAGLDRPSSGHIFYDQLDLTTLKEHELANFRASHVGIILQNFALLLNESVESNVTLPLLFQKGRKKKAMSVEEVLNICQIPGFEKRKVKELSGGEMQRVAIARALIARPDILIADEPTGSLDSDTSMSILELLKSLHDSGMTILMVTHDEEIASLCQRIIHIRDGKLMTGLPGES